jgi:Fic family protein
MNAESSRPVGYGELIARYGLSVIPNWHTSAVAANNIRRVASTGDRTNEPFPARLWPGGGLGDQLEFALKYDGTNLLILAKLFAVAPQTELTAYIRSKPTGKYTRRLWYLYELLTGRRLPISDISQGNYVDLLDPKDYFVSRSISIQRQRIRDNLLGDARFCPMVRRTARLIDFENSGLAEKCRKVMEAYPAELLRRALGYLYTKESKSSFEIEHIAPSAARTARFVTLLQTAETEDFVNRPALIELQNRIVDERFKDLDYRKQQNYVGETIAWQNERIHFISPRPADLGGLMDGIFAAHRRMGDAGVHPVVHAAVIAYAFVFMHPFEDGNGRIHRFLIHNVLAKRGFTPQGIMFPVSAVMLKDPAAYDASLEAFSRPLIPLVEYDLDDRGRMTVHNQTADYYRYIDMTAQVEALFEFIRRTIETELVDELTFLLNYDRTKRAIQSVVDMPDRLIDLFIRCCLQNQGRLSKRKRALFATLRDSEIARMEAAVRNGYATG